MAELFGRETGLCGGHGGSMHLMDRERAFYGGYGIVAVDPLAVGLGYALALPLRRRGARDVSATAPRTRACSPKSMNMAKPGSSGHLLVPQQPVRHGHRSRSASATRSYSPRAEAFDITSRRVDGMDALAVHQAVSDAADHARTASDPVMIEAIAYRYRGHSMSDPDKTRPRTKRPAGGPGIPWSTFERVLLGEGIVDADDLAAIRERNMAIVEDAATFAAQSPEVPPAALADHIYARPWNDDPRGPR